MILSRATGNIILRDSGSCHSLLPDTGSGHSTAQSDISRPSFESHSIDSNGVELINKLSKHPMQLRARCEVSIMDRLFLSILCLDGRGRGGKFQEMNWCWKPLPIQVSRFRSKKYISHWSQLQMLWTLLLVIRIKILTGILFHRRVRRYIWCTLARNKSSG